MNTTEDKIKTKLFLAMFAMLAAAMGLLFWNQYRPRMLLAQCSEIALVESQAYTRAGLDIDNIFKPYDTLVNDCLQDFGV